LKDYLDNYVYPPQSATSGMGGYHFDFNDLHSIKLREELNIDCVPMIVVLDPNLEIVTMDGAADLM